MEDRENAYRYWLHHVPELGEKASLYLMEKRKSARLLYDLSPEEMEKLLLEGGWRQKVAEKKAKSCRSFRESWDVTENYERMLEKGIRMVSIWEEHYPERLKKMQNPPMILYYLGCLPQEKECSLAIVGARECSEYGAYTARAFGEQLGKAGINIISGMARGIDGISQKAALLAGGKTFAVLGCGVDVCYPASNYELYEAIQEKGGIISSFVPGTSPGKRLFPYRNGIVAGLSDAVLVVEARQKSGTFITVDMALEQGKDVYAVPGRLTDRLSDGCNLLLRQGAGIALAPEDLLAELSVLKNRKGKEKEKKKRLQQTGIAAGETAFARAEKEEEKEELKGILRFLDVTPKSADEILESVRRAGMDMTLPQLLFELIRLCLTGKVNQVGGNYFSINL